MFDASQEREFPWWLLVVVAFSLVAAAGLISWWMFRLPGEAPPLTYTWMPPAGDRFAEVHVQHWPEWTVARERASVEAAIVASLEGEEALESVATALLEAAELLDPAGAADAADVWNAALEARDLPWALKIGAAGDRVYAKTFFIVGRVEVAVGSRETEVAIGKRVDRTNVVEAYLGAAEDIGGALIVSDRVLEFATAEIWPMLGSDDRAIAAAIRDELGRTLPPRSYRALVATADSRAEMMATERAVAERQACGSDFRMRVPWTGIDGFPKLWAYVEHYRGQNCPGLLEEDVRTLIAGTVAIRTEPDLWEALENLVAWAARHVVVHEARHRLDQEDWGFGEPPPCEGCGVSGRALVESSAYVSALASDDGIAAVVQMCGMVAATEGGSPRRGALAVLEALQITCDDPPEDLAHRAKKLARDWFSRDETWTLRGMPARAPLALVEPQ